MGIVIFAGFIRKYHAGKMRCDDAGGRRLRVRYQGKVIGMVEEQPGGEMVMKKPGGLPPRGALQGAGEETEGREAEALKARWEELLLPASVRLGEYLSGFAGDLNAGQRRIRLRHRLDGYGEVVSYGKAPFVCRISPGRDRYEIEFSFVAWVASEECSQARLETPAKLRLLQGVLQAHGLAGELVVCQERGDAPEMSCLRARGRLAVRLLAQASRQSGVLSLSLNQIETLGCVQRQLPAEAVDAAFFEALGRYLLRELPSLSHEALRGEVREQLQAQVQRGQVLRMREAELAERLGEDEQRCLALMAPSAAPLAKVRQALQGFRRRFFGGSRPVRGAGRGRSDAE